MSLNLLAMFCFLLTLHPAFADSLGCASVERVDNSNGALTVWLRNGCAKPIAALSLVPNALDLPAQTTTEVDFTVGIGLPEVLVPRLPPGTSVGLFVPGSVRDASAPLSPLARHFKSKLQVFSSPMATNSEKRINSEY